MSILNVNDVQLNEITHRVGLIQKIKPIIWNSLGEYANEFDKYKESEKNGEKWWNVSVIDNNTGTYMGRPTILMNVYNKSKKTYRSYEYDEIVQVVKEMADAIITKCKEENISITTKGKVDVNETLYIFFTDFEQDDDANSSKWPSIRFSGDNFTRNEIGIGIYQAMVESN